MLETPLLDLCHTSDRLRNGSSDASHELERCIAVAQSPACENVFMRTMFGEARAAAATPGIAHRPLHGLAVSVKDLFNIQGQVTVAGSTVLADRQPAAEDCPAVQRLRRAGGVIIGRTNMVEFAFSGVGVNPHFGTPRNAADPQTHRIPGGSSSGAVVSVATGAAFIGLGSDTGGSIRIPAALNGIVGFKCTASTVPADGSIPLSPSMDTVCALTRSVADAIVAHEVLAACTVRRNPAPLKSWRLAVSTRLMHDGLDATVARAYEVTLAALRRQGATIEEIDLPELDELPGINATGGLSPAESYAWHRTLLREHQAQYDPRVAARILRGASMSAADYIDLLNARRDWTARMNTRLRDFDALLSPTVPIVAPPLAEVAPGAERDQVFFRVNAQLLRNTSVVNMLDGCALSLPCQRPGDLPVGLMIWHGAQRDDNILNIALQVEQALRH